MLIVSRFRHLPWPSAIVLSILLGFAVTYAGTDSWDDPARIRHSRWLLSQLGLVPDVGNAGFGAFYYGALWEYILGIASEIIFSFLRDPNWVRHACTWALYPLMLLGTYRLLLRADIQRATAVLSVALLFGLIRLQGHALVNVKDFPAAAAYLIVTLLLWVFLKEWKRKDGTYSSIAIISMTVASLIPFLIRPPLLLHSVLLFGVLMVSRSRKKKTTTILLFAGVLTIVISLLYPPVAEVGLLHGLRLSFTRFLSYEQWNSLPVLGTSVSAHDIPWWYAIAWIPVITNPIAFVTSLGALGLLLWKRGALLWTGRSLKIGSWNCTLVQWIGITFLLSWLGVIIFQPILYDEERHLLFLYPLFFLACGLFLSGIPSRFRYGLAGLIVLSSLWSYGTWGVYAYVYQSSLARSVVPLPNAVDYWGACLGRSIRALPSVTDGSIPIVLRRSGRLVDIRMASMHESMVRSVADIPEYQFVSDVPRRPYAVLTHNQKSFGLDDIVARVGSAERGAPQLLFKEVLPTGNAGCVLAYYPVIGE